MTTPARSKTYIGNMFRKNNRVRNLESADKLIESGYDKLNNIIYGNLFESHAMKFLVPEVISMINQ